MLRVTAHKPHHIPQVVAVHGDEIIVGLIVPPGHLPGGLACTAKPQRPCRYRPA